MKKLKTFENYNLKTKIFHNYSEYEKTKTGLWGSEDSSLYSHLGTHKIFSFNIKDKVLMVDADGYYPVVSESIFYKIASNEEEELSKELELSDVYMDYIVNIYLKEHNYDGAIYKTEEGLIAVDLREYTVEELKTNLDQDIESDFI